MRTTISRLSAGLLRRVGLGRRSAPARGYTAHLNEIKFVDDLSDADLAELNAVVDWKSFVADRHGRRFGNVAWAGKRTEPQAIPDPRIVLLDQQFSLADKEVLEIGCFEGNHTVGLARYAKRVTAVDARISNVVKTVVRCALFDVRPTVFKCDVEDRPLRVDDLRADIVHHVGVLYHLMDPVRHLRDLGAITRGGLMLDTHYAPDADATDTYVVDGQTFRYKRYREFGRRDPFSGMHGHSKWLRLDDILELLAGVGLGDVRVLQTREERNGPRLLLIVGRQSPA